MSKPNVLLLGAGGHAHACLDVFACLGDYHIAGLIGNAAEVSTQHLGYPVVGTDEDLPRLARSCEYAFVAVGHIQTADVRKGLYRRLIDLGFKLPVVIAPTAHVSRHARVGAGSIVMHGAIVNAGAEVGENCIINSRALVEHDATVGDCCHISTGAILNGNVSVGEGSYIGSGCTVKEGLSIGRDVIVGMGLAVRHSQVDGARYVGEVRS
jgi:sugar O-acyltransferase (sialic acid O-acetyltransferase NeuD family)